MSVDASDKCVRSFGFVQASWATRNTNQDEDEQAEHEARFDKLVASFQSEFSAVVKYTNNGTIEFEFCKPGRLPLEDRIYDPDAEIMAVDGSSQPPKKLRDLTTIVMLKGMQAEGICPAITLETKCSNPSKWFACGRNQQEGGVGSFCWRHKLTRSSYEGAHAGREVN
jgi:hypothetical protein